MKILVLNWLDPENPQAGGAEVHFHEIFRRLVARETRVLEQIMARHPEPFRVPDHL